MTKEETGKYLNVASRRDWFEIINALCELRAWVESKDEASRTALSHAAEMGALDSVNELLTHGANPNAADADQQTPLWWAANSGRKVIVER